MIKFIKSLFGSKPAEVVAEVPYKVEVAEVTPAFPVETKPAKSPKAKTPAKGKKPTVKKATTRKPKAPKAPK